MPSAPEGFVQLKDGTYETAWLDYAMGAISALGGAAMLWSVRNDLVVDINSPDFNPLVLLAALTIAVGLFLLARAALKSVRKGRFGESILEMKAEGPRAGKPFSAKLSCERISEATGTYEITMKFIETFDFRDRGEAARKSTENVRWEEKLSVSAASAPLRDGVRVQFQLPSKKELQRSQNPGAQVKAAVALNFPGRKSEVLAHNVLPNSVRWLVEIEAAAHGKRYTASWGLPVSEPFPVRSFI